MAGTMVHFEVPAGDTGRSREFWGSLFGWQFQPFEGPFEYHLTRVSDDQGGAIQPAQGGEQGIRVYFDVDDIRASTARVRELGGDSEEAMPVPAMGWFARCKDVDGNEFGMWQTDPEAPTPEL